MTSQAVQQPTGQNATQPLPSTHASLYVGDLDESVTESMIYDKFSRIGTIISIRVCRDMISKKSLGYAYVNFALTSEAEKAIDELNFDTLRKRQMRIMWSQRDPSLRKSGVGNLFIKNLDKKIQVRDLYDTFSTIGDILSCKIPVDNKGNSKGHGFVHFVSKDAADTAVDKLNGSILNDKQIFVGYFVPRQQRSNSAGGAEPMYNNLYVKNFGEEMDEDKLRAMFEEFGEITSVFVSKHGDSLKSRGFGFVCFRNCQDALRATRERDQTVVNGRAIYVGRAMKKSERSDHLRVLFEARKAERTAKYIQGVNLYVKNLDDSIDDEALRAAFVDHGAISSVKVMRDQSNRSKGFGFVCFARPEDATKAVTEMSGRLVAGKPLYVALAQRKEERRAHLQSQMLDNQLAYRNFPPNFSASMMSAQFANPLANPAMQNQMLMYPSFANQHNFALPNVGHSFFPLMANRMIQQLPRPPQRWPPIPTSVMSSNSAIAQAAMGHGANLSHLQYYARPQVPNAPTATQLLHAGQQTRLFHPQSLTRQHAPGFIQQQQQRAAVNPQGVQQIMRPVNMNSTANFQYVPTARNIAAFPPQPQTDQLNNVQTVVSTTGEEDESIKEFVRLYRDAKPREQEQIIGEMLYKIVQEWYPDMVGKLTGMILEIDASELMALILQHSRAKATNTPTPLRRKVDEAWNTLVSSTNINKVVTSNQTTPAETNDCNEKIASD